MRLYASVGWSSGCLLLIVEIISGNKKRISPARAYVNVFQNLCNIPSQERDTLLAPTDTSQMWALEVAHRVQVEPTKET